jgi:type IV secretion system protein VirB10
MTDFELWIKTLQPSSRQLRLLMLGVTFSLPVGFASRGRCQSPQTTPATQPIAQAPTQISKPQDSAPEGAAGHAGDAVATPETAIPAAPTKKTYTVPAGTKVLLQLRSAINTKSAKPGDGVYLASTFPVVVGTRVLIPAGVYVQGIVDNVVRPGRVKGKAQLNLHFSSIIFPNGTVVEIPGIINSLPGAHDRTVDSEGKVEENGNKGRDVARAAQIGLQGAGVGGLGGAISGHPLEGAAIGGLGGVAVGTVIALFTRGDDINIENGTPVEMVLQRPLVLEESNLSASAPDGGVGAGSVYLPAQNQPRPLDKPSIHRAQILCPPGGLGCN